MAMLSAHYGAKRRYTTHLEQNIPLVVWRRGQPWAFADTCEKSSPLKGTPDTYIERSRLERLYTALERRSSEIRENMAVRYNGEKFMDMGRCQRYVHPQAWMLIWATDGLFGAYLPTGDPFFNDHLRIDPQWCILLNRSFKRAKPRPKRPTRLEQKDLATRAYSKVQRSLRLPTG